MRWRWSLLLACAVGACQGDGDGAIERITPPAGVTVERLRVSALDAEGLSGGARGDNGELWVVAERQRRLLRMQLKGDALVMNGAAITLDGLAVDLEAESLAWLGDNRLLIGTETGSARAREVLLLMTVTGTHASITRRLEVNYAALGVQGEDNHGIEGACAVGDRWVLALEQRGADGAATLLVYDIASGGWQVRRLLLTTATGKLASLDCWAGAADGAIEGVAIERHYGVGRLLAFTWKASASDRQPPIVPRVLMDLAQVAQPLPNFESVVVDGADVIVITDNHHARVTGPTQALRLRGLKLRAE